MRPKTFPDVPEITWNWEKILDEGEQLFFKIAGKPLNSNYKREVRDIIIGRGLASMPEAEFREICERVGEQFGESYLRDMAAKKPPEEAPKEGGR